MNPSTKNKCIFFRKTKKNEDIIKVYSLFPISLTHFRCWITNNIPKKYNKLHRSSLSWIGTEWQTNLNTRTHRHAMANDASQRHLSASNSGARLWLCSWALFDFDPSTNGIELGLSGISFCHHSGVATSKSICGCLHYASMV